MTKESRFSQVPAAYRQVWGAVEWLYWPQEVNDCLRGDTGNALFNAAYDAVDWKSYCERLKGTPFYDWAMEENGAILSFGGPAHIERSSFFSTIGDMTTAEERWLKAHPEFNQVLHDIHVETVEQMVDYILTHGQEKRKRRRK
jgi:hypothetical protein